MSETISSPPPPSDSKEPEVPYQYQELIPDAYHTTAETPGELHERYIAKTGELIQKMVGVGSEPGYDTVVFLDKSARPLAWMVRKLWPHIAPQQENPTTGETETVPMPAMKFANIDRIHWREDPSKPFSEGGDMRDITDEDIEGLRQIFDVSPQHSLSEKRVLIIDEQSETGDTLKAAKVLFDNAFPESTFDTAAWISPEKKYNASTGEHEVIVKEIPVWYPQKDAKSGLFPTDGRGILDPNPTQSRALYRPGRFTEGSWKFLGSAPRLVVKDEDIPDETHKKIQELGAKIDATEDQEEKHRLSHEIRKLHTSYDKKSLQLRQDIGQMAIDFAKGKLMPRVPTSRETIQGMPRAEYYKKRNARKK